MPDMNLILSNCISGALYPVTYVKVLIQIGYEPCPPQPGKTFFGRPILVLPGILPYSSHIYGRLVLAISKRSGERAWRYRADTN